MANQDTQLSAVAQRTPKGQRLIYVEPNDVFDADAVNQQQGQNLTPRYEDFCISFNLIVERVNRMKKSCVEASSIKKDEKGEVDKFSITWGLTKEEMEKNKKHASFLQGTTEIDPKTGLPINIDRYDYLTTYYTDLSHETYKQKTEIEGLGVESVQISYESWYTPTVVIKFVDVRGASLFGREEAVHVDENLQAENIFGAFFTMPYPLFRLQVKGFLGKPVTYQLTCSNFKGEFNSQTGNFEAVATFIGYSWSLLTDIPFSYLVAAPYDKYRGEQYWKEHKHSAEWGLWNGNDEPTLPPPTLYDLFQNIKAALTADVGKGNAEQRAELESITNESVILKKILNEIENLKKALKNEVSKNFIEDNDSGQLLLFHTGTSLNISSEEVGNAYRNLYNTIQEYINGGFNGIQILEGKMPHGLPASWKDEVQGESFTTNELNFLHRFNVTTDNAGGIITVIGIKALNSNGVEITDENFSENDLSGVTYNNDGDKLSPTLLKTLVEEIGKKNNKIKDNCCLIDFLDIIQSAQDRLNNRTDRENRLNDEIEEQVNQDIVKVISKRDSNNEGTGVDGFKPYIGNVFKIVFCHLETFCHIMLEAAQEIYEQKNTGDRSPSKLGIDITSDNNFPAVDITEGQTDQIGPWPAIFTNPEVRGGYVYGKTKNTYGWPGDLSTEYINKFIEVQVVYGLQEGIEMVAKQQEQEKSAEKLIGFPILPTDYSKNHNVFANVNIDNVTDLAGYLAIRMANIFGVCHNGSMSPELSKQLGRLDAYNLYERYSSISAFSSVIDEKVNIQNIKDAIYCNPNNDIAPFGQAIQGQEDNKRFNFETRRVNADYNNQNRHPFFKDNDDKCEYIHYYDESNIKYVPSRLKIFSSYDTANANAINGANFIFKFNIVEGKYWFEPTFNTNNGNNITSNDWCYTCDSSKISAINGKIENYTNDNMFKVITSDSEIMGIKNKFSELKGSGKKVGDYEISDDLTGFLDTFVKVGSKYVNRFFKEITHMLSGNADKLGLDKSCFLPEANGTTIPSTLNYNEWYSWYDKSCDAIVEQGSTREVKVNNNCELQLNGENITLSDLVIQDFKMIYCGSPCSLFGCPFYYLQEQIPNDSVKLKVKALLFLHTFMYDYKNIKLNVFNVNKTNGATEEVPKGYLLLLGGLLWRKRYSKNNNGVDPVIYRDADNGDVYQQPDVNHTFFDVKWQFKVRKDSIMGNRAYQPISAFWGGVDIDFNIENQLIRLFENFAEDTFNKISNRYDITPFKDYTKCKNHIEDIAKLNKSIIGGNNTIVINNINLPKNPQTLIAYLTSRGLNEMFGKYWTINTFEYSNPLPSNFGLNLLFNENDTEYQNLFKDLYFGTYIIADSCYRRMTANGTTGGNISFSRTLMDSYLNGFIDACNNIKGVETQRVGEGNHTIDVSKEVIKNKDLSVAIYYYLKNLWDKWLIAANSDGFDVVNFFNKNFIFADSFYKNIYSALAINCDKLFSAWNELAGEGSLFHFLSRICSDHNCIFLPVPDYVGFDGQTREHDIEMMENLFRPLPYNAMEEPSNNNKFVVMYTHSPSHTKDETNGFPQDSYDLFSHDKGEVKITEVAKDLFGSTNEETFDRSGDIATRAGYNIPSFGIEFARQNNHIFKNLKLTMDNPVMTEQAIKAQWNILLKAGNQDRSICFIGQDTFNVFTNYSYTINVEMMGNAQICPLMYFQLMNVPMWRGTYMIFKVEHNMTPGNMITTITGMKMNKFAQPFNDKFFIKGYGKPQNNNNNALVDSCDDDCEPISNISAVGVAESSDIIQRHITRMEVLGRRNGAQIKYIAIHYTAGGSSKRGMAENVVNVFNNPKGPKASADFAVDDETMVQLNPDLRTYYCFAVGGYYTDTRGARLYKKAVNHNTISIEMCSTLKKGTTAKCPNHDGWSLTSKTVEQCVKLTKFLMKKYNIPVENVVRHYDISGKLCPGVFGWNDGPIYENYHQDLPNGKHKCIPENPLRYNNSEKWQEFLKLLN